MGLHAPTKANVVFNLETPNGCGSFPLFIMCASIVGNNAQLLSSSIRCGTSLCMISLLHSKYARGCLYYVFKPNHNFQIPCFSQFQFFGGGQT
jgi:hypothetical protein